MSKNLLLAQSASVSGRLTPALLLALSLAFNSATVAAPVPTSPLPLFTMDNAAALALNVNNSTQYLYEGFAYTPQTAFVASELVLNTCSTAGMRLQVTQGTRQSFYAIARSTAVDCPSTTPDVSGDSFRVTFDLGSAVAFQANEQILIQFVQANSDWGFGAGFVGGGLNYPVANLSFCYNYFCSPGSWTVRPTIATDYSPAFAFGPKPSTPVLSLSTSNLDFGVVDVGAAKALTLTVTNNGATVLQGVVSAVAPYAIVSSLAPQLLPGQTADVSIRFVPTAAGRFDQTIALSFFGVAAPIQVAGYGFVPDPRAPYINKVPPSLAIGSSAVIEGRRFGFSQGASTVTLGDVPVQVMAWYDTLLRIVVPAVAPGSTSLRIITSRGPASVLTNVLPPAPVISKLGDASLSAGSTLAVWGQNFGAPQPSSTISIAGQDASIVQWNDKFITAKVPIIPPGTYAVTVRTSSGVAQTTLRVRNVVATIGYDPCAIGVDFSAYFGRRLSPICPPLVVSASKGAFLGTVDLTVENIAARWYKVTAIPLGTTLPVYPRVLGPKSRYAINGIPLATNQAVAFTVDSNADYAVAFTALDYLTQFLGTLGLPVPAIPRDAPDLASLVADLLATNAPFAGAVLKVGSGLAKGDFMSVFDSTQTLLDLFATDPRLITLATRLGITGAKEAASGFAEVVRVAKAVALAAETFEAAATAPVFGTATVVGK